MDLKLFIVYHVRLGFGYVMCFIVTIFESVGDVCIYGRNLVNAQFNNVVSLFKLSRRCQGSRNTKQGLITWIYKNLQNNI